MKAMKRGSILVLMTVLLMYGCSEENPVVQQVEDTALQQVEDTALKMSAVNGKGEIESTRYISPSDFVNSPQVKQRSLNPNQLVTGDYISPTGVPVEVSAISNNGGIHGNIFWQSQSLGKIEGRSICVSTAANGEATIAFLIESVEFPTGPWQENNIAFMKFRDNGEGADSPPDNDSEFLLIYTNWFLFYDTPEDFLIDINCNTLFNDPSLGGWRELDGQIQVQQLIESDDLITGTLVTIPLFDESPVEVPLGSKITVAFSFQDVLDEANCDASLTQAQIDGIMADAFAFTDPNDLEIIFDGKEIDVNSFYAEDGISTVLNNIGDCTYILPWRYYVNPQKAGTYTLTTSLDGLSFSREVTWVERK